MLEYKNISEAQSRPNRDYARIWDLEEGNFLAFVADAPSDAEQRTGLYINNYIEENFSEFKDALHDLEPEEISLVLADLITEINDELLRIGKGRAYSTIAVTLVFNEYIYAVTVGDSAAYVIGSPTCRLSEITRIKGQSVLKNITEEALNTIPEPIRYKKYSYIGNEPRCFVQSDVWRLPTEKARLVALVSDGAEVQFGVKNLLRILISPDDLDRKENAIRQKLIPGQMKDDVTILLAPVKVDKPSNLRRYMRQELNVLREEQKENLAKLDSDLNILDTALQEKIASKLEKGQFSERIDELKESFHREVESVEKKFEQNYTDILEKLADTEQLPGDIRKLEREIEEIKNDQNERARKVDHFYEWYQQTGAKVNQLTANALTLDNKKLKKFVDGQIENKTKDLVSDAELSQNLDQVYSHINDRFTKLKSKIRKAGVDEAYKIPTQKITVGRPEDETPKSKRFSEKLSKVALIISAVVIAILIIYIAYSEKASKGKGISPTPTPGKTTETTKDQEVGESITPASQIPSSTPKPLFDKNYRVYLAYLHPENISFSASPPPIEDKICETYQSFIEAINSLSEKKVLMLPIQEVIENWEKLKVIQSAEYTVTPPISMLTLKLIPKKFFIREKRFKELQQGYTGNFKFGRGEKFNYISFYYRIEIKEDMEPKKLAEKFKLPVEELDLYTKDAVVNQKIAKGKFLNLPLTIEPPDIIKD